MPLRADELVMRRPGVAVSKLPLSPEGYFVYARVEGSVSLHDLCVAVGLPEAEVKRIVTELLSIGALQRAEAANSASSPVRAATRDPVSEGDRRREALRRQMTALRQGGAVGASEGPADRHRVTLADGRSGRGAADDSTARRRSPSEVPTSSRGSTASEPSAGGDRAAALRGGDHAAAAPSGEAGPSEVAPFAEIKLAAEADERLDPRLEIPVAEQRLLLGVEDAADTLTHFGRLGIAPTADSRAVRDGYYAVSRRFHPDAFYGREIGPYAEIMGRLFERARVSYDFLRDPDRRATYLEQLLLSEGSRRDRTAKAVQGLREARAAAEEERRLAEARAQRDLREQERLQRRRDRMNPVVARRGRASEYAADAEKAAASGDAGQAANLYRLAAELEPGEASYHHHWHRYQAIARADRAQRAFTQAHVLLELGKVADAARRFLDAAEANPTARHLAAAATAVSATDPVKGRELALGALDALHAGLAMGSVPEPKERALIHLAIAQAFLAAGQVVSAKEQLDLAHAHDPSHAEVRALLKSAKLT